VITDIKNFFFAGMRVDNSIRDKLIIICLKKIKFLNLTPFTGYRLSWNGLYRYLTDDVFKMS